MAQIKKVTVLGLASLMGLAALAPAVSAQDVSPTLLIETAPSDIGDYRRMVHVKYLRGNRIDRSFVAYNRTEFKRIDRQVSQEIIDNCANGSATSLSEIRSFARNEMGRFKAKRSPESRFFCIKNVRNWTGQNRDKYLDPIFETLPYSVQAF